MEQALVTTQQPKPTPKKRRLSSRQKEGIAGWLFAMPVILGLLLFTFVPVILSFIWSFYDYDGLLVNNFVGFDNYSKIFLSIFNPGALEHPDKSLQKVVLNTILYTFASIAINLVLSYLLALLVNNNHRFTKVFRVLYYLPCVIPAVVNGLLWKDITDNTYGVFNKVLAFFGISGFTWFTQASTSMLALFIMSLWGLGGGMILWLSAFKNIPKVLYEAATIDGANTWQKFVHITIPLSTPIIFFNVVTSVIGTLQFNGTLVIATRDGRGVDDSLYLAGVKIYYEAFRRGQIGYAAALSWILCIVISILTLILFVSQKKWVFYGKDQ